MSLDSRYPWLVRPEKIVGSRPSVAGRSILELAKEIMRRAGARLVLCNTRTGQLHICLASNEKGIGMGVGVNMPWRYEGKLIRYERGDIDTAVRTLQMGRAPVKIKNKIHKRMEREQEYSEEVEFEKYSEDIEKESIQEIEQIMGLRRHMGRTS